MVHRSLSNNPKGSGRHFPSHHFGRPASSTRDNRVAVKTRHTCAASLCLVQPVGLRGAHVICFIIMLLFLPAITWAASIVMEWDYTDEPLNPAVSFSMYRDVGCTGDFLFLDSVPRNQLTYADTTVAYGQLYCYYVTATAASGEESGASNTIQFQMPLPRPLAPGNLHGVALR